MIKGRNDMPPVKMVLGNCYVLGIVLGPGKTIVSERQLALKEIRIVYS